jgi:hypothetical protein
VGAVAARVVAEGFIEFRGTTATVGAFTIKGLLVTKHRLNLTYISKSRRGFQIYLKTCRTWQTYYRVSDYFGSYSDVGKRGAIAQRSRQSQGLENFLE